MDPSKLKFLCECGNDRFILRADGVIECPNCDAYFEDMKVVFPKGIPLSDEAAAEDQETVH